MGGRRKKKSAKKRNKDEEDFPEEDDVREFVYIQSRGAKGKSKLDRRMKKKMNKLQDRNMQTKRHKPDEVDRCGFHRVSASIKKDIQIDKKFLLTSIRNYVEEPFCALGFFRDADDTMNFYFDANKNVAESIRSLDKKISSKNGELIGLKVKFVTDTDFIPNCDQTELLKNVVLQRFNRSNGFLNLSSFHLDPQFVESDTFVPLSNKIILKQVFSYIKELMPEVNAFDLSNNKLTDGCLELLETMDLQSHSLTAVNLENNNLNNVKCLEHLRFFPLNELKVLGNNFRGEKPSTKSYTRAVLKAVPFLKILDGVDVESRLTRSANSLQMDVIPKNEASITEENVKTFLEQYYSLFDSDNRGTLLQAYVPTAKIQLNSQNPLIPNKTFEGQDAIQEFLNSWPKSKHDHSSFCLEVLKLSSEEGISQVQGICAIAEPQLTLQFKRIMKVVPFNTGFCCVEDMLWIS